MKRKPIYCDRIEMMTYSSTQSKDFVVGLIEWDECKFHLFSPSGTQDLSKPLRLQRMSYEEGLLLGKERNLSYSETKCWRCALGQGTSPYLTLYLLWVAMDKSVY